MAIITIKLESSAYRIALAAVLLVYLTGVFFFAKWFFGNAISLQSGYKEVTALAVSLAPDDPQPHYALAVLTENTFLREVWEQSLAEYEKTAALSPADFRAWLALGKARERIGDPAGAQLALRKALSLAPAYSQVHWTLGNVLLRDGRTEEAYSEIRRAAESDRTYLEPAVSTAWQIFDGDLAEIRKNLGGSVEINFVLVTFLAKQKHFDQALEIWKTLPTEAKKTRFRETGKILAAEMHAAKKYRDALEVQNEIAESEADTFTVGQIFNAGFEMDVKPTDAGFFEWQIGDAVMPQIGFDNAQKHGGNRSLVILFNSTDGQDFRSLSQTIAVEGNKKYRFGIFFRSELKTTATFLWEIVDTADGKILASTDPIPAASDWADLSKEFSTGETTEAVTIRLAREKCGKASCPISGRVWFDDFLVSSEQTSETRRQGDKETGRQGDRETRRQGDKGR